MERNPFNFTQEQIEENNKQALVMTRAISKPQVYEDMIFCAPLNVEQVQITEEL